MNALNNQSVYIQKLFTLTKSMFNLTTSRFMVVICNDLAKLPNIYFTLVLNGFIIKCLPAIIYYNGLFPFLLNHPKTDLPLLKRYKFVKLISLSATKIWCILFVLFFFQSIMFDILMFLFHRICH